MYCFLFQQLVKSNSSNKNSIQINRKFNIKGIKNKVWLKEVKKLFKLDELEIISKEMSKEDIDNLLTKIRLSGFFKEVQLNSIIINNTQIITFNFSVNPLLLHVYLSNNKNLLISQDIVLNLFSDQIGYPKSFRKMHNAIQGIYKWYNDKGFKWVKVEILDNKKNINSVNIKISEGIINSIQFHCPYTNQTSINNNNYLLESIRRYLKLEENIRLNYKKIEKGIEIIKNKKIVDNCDYIVNYSTKHRDEVDLIINLYNLADKATYLEGKNITLTTEIIETIEANLYNSLNFMLKNYISSSADYSINMVNIIKPSSTIYSSILYNTDNKCSVKHINSIMVNKKLYVFTDLYEWYINTPILNKNNYFKLKHYIRNLGKHQEYFNLDFEIPIINNEFNGMICIPWIYIIKKYAGDLEVEIVQKSFNLKSNSIVDVVNQLINYNFLLSRSTLNIKKLDIKFNYKTNSKVKLIKLLGLNHVDYEYKCIKNKNFKYSYLKTAYIKQIYKKKNLFLHRLPKLNKKISHDYLNINLELKYSSNDTHDINWRGKGVNLKMLSQFFIPIKTLQNFYTKHYYNKFIHKYIIKSTVYFNYGINKLNKKKQFIISHLKIGNIFGCVNLLPIAENLELTIPYAIRGYNESYIGLPKTFYKFSLEYHKAITQLNNLFLFFDYICIVQRKLRFIKIDLNRILFADNSLNDHKFNGSIGLGIQFRVPIKQLPAIRLEYAINIVQNSYLHLRVATELSDVE
nr:hypothetical protein [Boldiaceae sp.]